MGFYDDFKKAFQDIVAPEIKAIYGEIGILRSEIKRLDEKIDSGLARLDGKIDSGLARLDEKIDLIKNELLAEIRRQDAEIRGQGDIMVAELKRIDNELRLLREMKDRTEEIEQLKQRISALEARIAA
ncbi:MAG: hypothetical protein AB1297_09000 [bacterium]